jgi:hypothetical protein
MLKLLMTSNTPKAPSSSCFHALAATTLKLLMTQAALMKLWQWKQAQKEVGGEGTNRMRER